MYICSVIFIAKLFGNNILNFAFCLAIVLMFFDY